MERYPIDRYPVPAGVKALVERGAVVRSIGIIVGVTERAMWRKVRGQCNFNFRDMLKLAAEFNCSLNDLNDPNWLSDQKVPPQLRPKPRGVAAQRMKAKAQESLKLEPEEDAPALQAAA